MPPNPENGISNEVPKSDVESTREHHKVAKDIASKLDAIFLLPSSGVVLPLSIGYMNDEARDMLFHIVDNFVGGADIGASNERIRAVQKIKERIRKVEGDSK